MATYEPSRCRVTWRLGGRRDGARQSLTLASPKDAKAVKALVELRGHHMTREQVLAQIEGEAAPTGPTVTEWCRIYVGSLSVEDGTRRDYERTVRLHIAPTPLGRMAMTAVTREAVRLWVRNFEPTGAAPKSVANRHALLSAAFNEATAEGLVVGNPCRSITLPRQDAHTEADDEACFLSPGEVALIAGALPAQYQLIPWLLVRTGLRWGEATALHVGDVDLLAKPPRLRVSRAWKKAAGTGWQIGPPKTPRSRRTITLDAATVDLLIPLVSSRPASAWLLTTTDGIRPLMHSTFYRAWCTALYGPQRRRSTKGMARDGGLVGAGLLEKRPRIHDLRHSHASWLLQDPNVNMYRLQRRLGHESITTTERVYGHLRQDDDAAILGALDNILVGQTSV